MTNPIDVNTMINISSMVAIVAIPTEMNFLMKHTLLNVLRFLRYDLPILSKRGPKTICYFIIQRA